MTTRARKVNMSLTWWSKLPAWQKMILVLLIVAALVVIAGYIPISSGGTVTNG